MYVIYGGHSLTVELRVVVPPARVQLPLATPEKIVAPESSGVIFLL